MTNLETQVKQKLNITWEDDETNAKVGEIISQAIPIMKYKLGLPEEHDFSVKVSNLEGMANALFLNYCLYEFNHVANEFDDNYANDILQCRAIVEVSDYETVS